MSSGELAALIAAAVVSASMSGCGGEGSPAGPSGSSDVRIILSLPSFGRPISLSVSGQTLSVTGTHEIRLSPGAHTMNGSFNPNEQVVPQLGISFIGHPTGGGGVRSGSLRSVTGPVLQTQPCTIVYSTLPGTTEPQSFSMQFEVTTDVNSACPVPGSF